MIVLDTNVISEVAKREPDPAAREWLAGQAIDQLYLCAPVISELEYGAQRIFLRDGSDRYLKAVNLLVESRFLGRILPFDTNSALLAGRFRADSEANGRSQPFVDCMIAAICAYNGAMLATRNTNDFTGFDLAIVNPFEPA